MPALSARPLFMAKATSGARCAKDPEHVALPTRELLVASVAICLSGAAGLTFQLVWVHRASLVFGVTLWAAAAVMSSFMAGLGVGSAAVAWFGTRVQRPLWLYAKLELVIAVSGILVTLALPVLSAHLPRAIGSVVPSEAGAFVVVAAITFAVLLVPATAMGATLPLIVNALRSSHVRFGDLFGRLYGWNTVGAVLGVLGTEIVMVAWLGILGSALVAAALNAGAAALALHLHFTSRALSRRELSRPARPMSPYGWRVISAAFLAGGSLLALEIVWVRFLSMFVIATTLTVSIMLCVVLAGIAGGGFTASIWVRRSAGAVAWLPGSLVTAGATFLVSYSVFQWVTHGSLVSEPWRVLWFGMALTFPTAFLSGLTYTLAGEALIAEVSSETRAAGWLALASTAGAAAGPLVASLALLPQGMEQAFLAISGAYALAAALVLRHPRIGGGSNMWRGAALGATALLGAAVLFPFGLMERVYFVRSAQPYTGDGSTIVAVREGAAETVLLLEKSAAGRTVYHRLLTNGFSMTGTAVPGTRYMRYFAYLPMLLHGDQLRRVLVVCYGLGVTAAAAADIESAETIDVVETSRDIVAMSDVVYQHQKHPLEDPRVRLHFQDGRQFLQATEAQFDLITGEPPPPLAPGAVNLYTEEYFRLVRDRLSEGGIATYWLPVARGEGANLAAVAKAFCNAFEDCSLWNATPADLMLVGTRNANERIPEHRLRAPWTTAPLRERFVQAGFERPEQIGATFIADAQMLRLLLADVEPLTDNYPRRLRLPFGKLPISDPRALFDHGGDAYLSGVLDTEQARHAFSSSVYIGRLWPTSVQRETLAYFDAQRVINRLFVKGANPLGHIEDLHYVLTRTDLERLALWLLGLGNHPVLSSVDSVGLDEGGAELQYVRGLRALATRKYASAALHFAEAERLGLGGSRALQAYALALDGQRELARRLARDQQPSGPDAQHFWAWMWKTFGLDEASAGA